MMRDVHESKAKLTGVNFGSKLKEFEITLYVGNTPHRTDYVLAMYRNPVIAVTENVIMRDNVLWSEMSKQQTKQAERYVGVRGLRVADEMCELQSDRWREAIAKCCQDS